MRLFIAFLLLPLGLLAQHPGQHQTAPVPVLDAATATAATIDTATLGMGCFWCAEAIFEQAEGVLDVESGIAGNHVEVVRIIYDNRIIGYPQLLHIFWTMHDPTSVDHQGGDTGTEYASVIFYHNTAQQAMAQGYKQQLVDAGTFSRPIVTSIEPLRAYQRASERHQDYYRQQKDAAYCTRVIRPKVERYHQQYDQRQ